MKKVILLVVAVVAAWLGINYARTGKLALFPSAANPTEQRVHELEHELAAIDGEATVPTRRTLQVFQKPRSHAFLLRSGERRMAPAGGGGQGVGGSVWESNPPEPGSPGSRRI